MLAMMKRPNTIHTVAAMLIALPALAQEAPVGDGEHTPEALRPAPETPATPAERLDELLAALRDEAAEDPERIAERVAELWSRSGSDSMDYLLMRGREAIAEDDYDKAVDLLDSLVSLEPGFAEGWNARATVHFLRDDYWSSVEDIQKVLELEPRHFGALAGLGMILERVGAEKAALTAHRAALEINPHIEGSQEAVKRLAPRVDGRDI